MALSSQMWRLQEHRALITGGTRGIGAATVDVFLALGCEVLFTARQPEEVQARVRALRQEGHQVHGLAADVSDVYGRQQLIEWIDRQWGGLDILVNNAGLNIRQSTLAYQKNHWQDIMATNLDAAWDMSRLAFVHLKNSREGGRIINVSSVAARTAITTSTAAYAASKAGLDQLTRFLAAEWGAYGIRVNSVQPWYIRTPLAEPVLQDPSRLEKIQERTPMGRVGEPHEVANVVAFLALPASSYISGAQIPIDGAFLCKGI